MDTKLSAIIIDDEPDAIAALEILLKNIDDIDLVGSTNESTKAVALFKQQKPDLVFLDIKLPGTDGFEILEEIYAYNYHPYVIFTTAYDEFALKALKAGAFDYLLKPVDSTELNNTVRKVLKDKDSHNLEKRIEELEKAIHNHRKLRFNTRSGFILIHPDDIFYIEADANYSEIYLSKENCEVVSMNLGAVEAMLPKQFIRISRSVIINSHYLEKISGTSHRCIIIKEGEEIQLRIPEKQISQLRHSFD